MRGEEARFGRDFLFWESARFIFFFTTVRLSFALETPAPALAFAVFVLETTGLVFVFAAALFRFEGFVAGKDIFSAGGSSTAGSGAAGNSSL